MLWFTPTTKYYYDIGMPHSRVGNDMGYGSSSYYGGSSLEPREVHRVPSPCCLVTQEIVRPPTLIETLERVRMRLDEGERFSVGVKLPKIEIDVTTERRRTLDMDWLWKKKEII